MIENLPAALGLGVADVPNRNEASRATSAAQATEGIADGVSSPGAFARDHTAFCADLPQLTQYLEHAVVASGRSPLAITREYERLARGRGQLTLPEYVQYRVYDPALDDDARQRFVSEWLCWPMTWACCDTSWQATTEDKWLCAMLLDAAGVPTPATLVVFDRSGRRFPGTRTIGSAAQLRDVLVGQCRTGVPVFLKPNRGVASFGTFIVAQAEATRCEVEGEGWLDYDRLVEAYIGAETYLLQPLLRNHPFTDRYTKRLATVRVYVLRRDTDLAFPFAVLKLAHADNVADNFWRPGNLACDVDPATGLIRTARTKDAFGTTDHVEHPVSGVPLVGETIPNWDDVLGVAREASPVFAPQRYQSMDIALLEDGPAVIEINTGGAFNLPQLASGRGFLSDEMLEFLARSGFRFGKPQRRVRGHRRPHGARQ